MVLTKPTASSIAFLMLECPSILPANPRAPSFETDSIARETSEAQHWSRLSVFAFSFCRFAALQIPVGEQTP